MRIDLWSDKELSYKIAYLVYRYNIDRFGLRMDRINISYEEIPMFAIDKSACFDLLMKTLEEFKDMNIKFHSGYYNDLEFYAYFFPNVNSYGEIRLPKGREVRAIAEVCYNLWVWKDEVMKKKNDRQTNHTKSTGQK